MVLGVKDKQGELDPLLGNVVKTGPVRIGRLSELLPYQRLCRASGLLLNVRLLQKLLQQECQNRRITARPSDITMFRLAFEESIEIIHRCLLVNPTPSVPHVKDLTNPFALSHQHALIAMRIVFQRHGLAAGFPFSFRPGRLRLLP